MTGVSRLRNQRGMAQQTAPLPPHNRDHPHHPPATSPTRESGSEGEDYTGGLGTRWMYLEQIENEEIEEAPEK